MEENKENLEQKKMDWKPVLMFYIKTTSWIVLPLVLALVMKNSFSEKTVFLFVIAAFGITCFGIYKEIKQYKKDLTKENKQNGTK